MNSKDPRLALSLLEKYFKNEKLALPALVTLKNLLLAPSSTPRVEVLPDAQYPVPSELGTTKRKPFALFSDGACRGNPGPGSWGAMAQDLLGEVVFEASGVDMNTTNNRMELSGAIEALKSLNDELEGDFSDVEIWLFSDSKYVVNGMEQWVAGWKRRGWKKADKKEPENIELWKELDSWQGKLGKYLHFCWVKGHSGHPQNERCDQLANEALDQAMGL